MAHELDRNERTGELAFAGVGGPQTAWHREGVALPEDAELEKALELAGLDFEVEKVPLFMQLEEELDDELVPGESPLVRKRYEQVRDAFAVVRTDRMSVLGNVGSVYTPLQNREAFEPLRELLESGVAQIETAGSLRGGQDVWMLVHFDAEAIMRRLYENTEVSQEQLAQAGDLVDDGELEPYGLVTNNHSGSRAVLLKETAVRVVCANTLAMSMDERSGGLTIHVEHSSNVKKNVESAARILFKSYSRRFASFAEKRIGLKRLPLEEREFRRLVLDPVVPVAHLEAKIARGEDSGRTHSALEKASERRGRIKELWTQGEGHRGDRSAWEAYNGLVQALDHDELFAPRRSDIPRVQSLYHGKLGRSKVKVLNRLWRFREASQEEREAMVQETALSGSLS